VTPRSSQEARGRRDLACDVAPQQVLLHLAGEGHGELDATLFGSAAAWNERIGAELPLLSTA
jgi:hypothetical protein